MKTLPQPFIELFRCLEDSSYEINFYGNDGNDNQEKIDGKQLLISWITDALFEVLTASQPSDVSDEDIDAFYPIKNEHTALTMQFIDTNKARREGAKAMRDGFICKSK